MDIMNCDVVKDLLPLYIDNVCSEKSKDIVENHIIVCDSCSDELKIMKEDININLLDKNSEENNGLELMRKIKKKIFKKKVLTASISSIFVITILVGMYTFLVHYELDVIAYDDISLRVEDSGKSKNIIYSGPDFYKSYGSIEKISEDDDTIYQSKTIYFVNSPFTKISDKYLEEYLAMWVGEYSGYTTNEVLDESGKVEGVSFKKQKITELYYSDGEGKEKQLIWKEGH